MHFQDHGPVGVAERVGLRIVDAQRHDSPDRVTLPMLARTRPRLAGVPIDGRVPRPLTEIRFEAAEAGGELFDLGEAIGGLSVGGLHGPARGRDAFLARHPLCSGAGPAGSVPSMVGRRAASVERVMTLLWVG